MASDVSRLHKDQTRSVTITEALREIAVAACNPGATLRPSAQGMFITDHTGVTEFSVPPKAPALRLLQGIALMTSWMPWQHVDFQGAIERALSSYGRGLNEAPDAADELERFAKANLPRDETYQALILSILAKQRPTIEVIRDLGANAVIEASLRHIAQLLRGDRELPFQEATVQQPPPPS